MEKDFDGLIAALAAPCKEWFVPLVLKAAVTGLAMGVGFAVGVAVASS